MHTIDAQGKKVGRIASEAAVLLMGKHKPAFQKNIASNTKVKIVNASKLAILPGRLKDTRLTRYTGHPGGLRQESLSLVVARKGYTELVHHSVYGMLPANSLRKKRMKNLFVTE